MRKCNIDTINFIRSIYNTNGDVYLHEPRFNGNEKDYLMETIDSTYVSSVGPFVDKFELEMSKLTNTARAVAVANGTCALQISLLLAGVKSGDEVLTQALTFVATANSISYLAASPIFIDVDLDTMGLSPTALEDFLHENAELRDNGSFNKKTGKRISACMPMHTFGFMCRIDEIVRICNKWKIAVVEDSAEALGSKYKKKSSGSFGLLSGFSLNGNKIITSGGGGAITTNNVSLGNEAKHLTTTAKVPHQWEYTHDKLGYNFRMPNINSALACSQLKKLKLFVKKRTLIANKYIDYFKNSKIFNVRNANKSIYSSWHLFILNINFKYLRTNKNKFLKYLLKKNIIGQQHYIPIYNFKFYKKIKKKIFLIQKFIMKIL